MSGTALLKVEDLTVRYGRATALDGVSLEVGEGERVALVGPNGAGKTTLLNAVCGLLRPAAGAVWLAGEKLEANRPAASVAAGISQVPEGRQVFPGLTVEDNLLVSAFGRAVSGHGLVRGALRYRRERGDSRRRLEDVYELLPALGSLKQRPAGLLSGGEQQMVAIGRALMARPRLLAVDELSLGLAPTIVADLLTYLKRLNEVDGMTILLVEQNVREALDFATIAFLLGSGSLRATGEPAELAKSGVVEEAFLGVSEER